MSGIIDVSQEEAFKWLDNFFQEERKKDETKPSYNGPYATERIEINERCRHCAINPYMTIEEQKRAAKAWMKCREEVRKEINRRKHNGNKA